MIYRDNGEMALIEANDKFNTEMLRLMMATEWGISLRCIHGNMTAPPAQPCALCVAEV